MVTGSNGVIRPPEDPADFLAVVPQVKSFCDFDFIPVKRVDGTLLNKDSIDMMISDWVAIATTIYQLRNDDYVGFVVVHGVDTMAYSASAVAFALGPNLNFPVVFVGGQSSATLAHGDGQINLIRACKVAATLPIAEVVICCSNRVFRGCRTQKRDDRDFDAFESPGVPPICVIKDSLDPGVYKKQKDNPTDISFRSVFADGILPVPITPATPPGMLLPAIQSEECRGVILQTPGGGNVPAVHEPSFIGLIQRCQEMGKTVIITSMYPYEPNEFLVYQSGIDAQNAGAIQITGIVFPALVTKLSWVLGQLRSLEGSPVYREQVEKLMKTPYVDELNPIPGFQRALSLPPMELAAP